MNKRQIISVLLFFQMFTFSCARKETIVFDETFFYPKSAQPYVYVFQDSLDPFFEMFERVITFYDPLGEHMLIERYNANFTLVESYDLLSENNYVVHNHTLYHNGKPIIAHVVDSSFVPWKGTGVFSSTFPGSVDSIMFSLKNKRSMNNEFGNFHWKEEKLETRIVTDSIFTLAIDLKNQKEKSQSVVAFHEFAQGLGRVRIKTADGKSNLVLQKILTDDEWLKLITK